MTDAETRRLFTLAGFDLLRMLRLPDGYDPSRGQPWWFVKTEIGWIMIGWCKRVIQIDWEDTPVRAVITPDDVTKHLSLVHAWSVEKALEYLRALRLAVPVEDAQIALRTFRDDLLSLARRCESDAFAHAMLAGDELRRCSGDGSEKALAMINRWFAGELRTRLETFPAAPDAKKRHPAATEGG